MNSVGYGVAAAAAKTDQDVASQETDVADLPKPFGDYRPDGHLWITLSSGEYYPDILPLACELYGPVLALFGQLLRSEPTSLQLFREITRGRQTWMRVQLARVFRKYVSPETPVEMLKRKCDLENICERFGPRFRPIVEVQDAFDGRPCPDEALCAILWEYKDRGRKGYDLTEKFFALAADMLPGFTFAGPRRAGKDIPLGQVFADHPNSIRPLDFVIKLDDEVLAVGLARYDSDRGGSQEDDRTGQYRECAGDILDYARQRGLKTKVVFVNDGPGLLLGTMWADYAALETRWPGRVMVTTLRMLPDRLTAEWLRS